MMNDERTLHVVDQLRHLVPGVDRCDDELEFIQSISNYILQLQAQLVDKQQQQQQPPSKRDVLRSLDSNERST